MKIVDILSRMPRHPTKQVTKRQLNAIRYWVLHHSLTTSGDPFAFANYHINTNNWSIMGYHYVVGREGTIYWCADHDIQTPHVGNSNRHALGVCMVGDFRTQTPTQAQYEAVLWLFSVHLPNILAQAEIKGHSEIPGYAWKACPVINMDKVRADVGKYKNGININKVEDDNMTKTQLVPVIKILEIWTDERQRNPLNKSWLEAAKKGELTVSDCIRLEFEAKVRGLKNSL